MSDAVSPLAAPFPVMPPIAGVRTATVRGFWLTDWKKRVGRTPLVAIGGIKLEQAREIFAAGADSIAVVSDVTQNADPNARVRAWLVLDHAATESNTSDLRKGALS